jgi:drug/metabolite transporter (DMT)-like permease
MDTEAQTWVRPRGPVFALLAAVLFGISAPLAKVLLEGAPPQLLAGLLYVGSGVGLAVVWLVRRQRRRLVTHGEAALTRRDAPWLVAAIGSGGVLGPLLLMLGLARTPAASASLLLNLEGVFTALVAWFVFREHVNRRLAIGMASIVAGGVLLSSQGRLTWESTAGPLLIAAACLSWAVDNNVTQKISAADPIQTAMLKGLVAGAVNVLIALALGDSWPAIPVVSGALLLGFLSYGVSLVLFVVALRHLGTARTGAYFSSAPFVGAGISFVLFREWPGVIVAGGAVLMVIGVLLHLTEHHEHEHIHETLEHEHLHVHDAHHQHAHASDDPPGEPHSHAHRHEPLVHTHAHYPDIHHRHGHG